MLKSTVLHTHDNRDDNHRGDSRGDVCGDWKYYKFVAINKN